jgi:GNAT superfamily N-acetyltransferase
MSLSINPVQGADDLEAFLRVPYWVYRDDPQYVHPLLSELRHFFDPDHNPFHKHADTSLWLARQDGHPVGRVAACVDSYHNEVHGERTGFFGFYEAPDDPGVAAALLAAAEAWLKERSMETMRGPSCFTTNHDWLGLQVDGEWTQPVVGMPYNPRYYQDQLEGFGLRKAKDLYAWRIRTEAQIPPKIQGVIDNLLQSNYFSVRPFRMNRFAEDASIVRELYNACWNQNWGFIPLDDAEFAYLAKDMKKMVDPRFLLIAEAKGRPIGFCLTVPDFNQALKPCRGRLFPLGWLRFLLAKRRIDYGRTLLMGVLPEYRKKGVDVVMVYQTIRAGHDMGVHSGECSWILEDNRAMNLILKGYGCELYKTYRIYDKLLT